MPTGLPVLLRMHLLQIRAAPETGGLLRVLFTWIGEVSARSGTQKLLREVNTKGHVGHSQHRAIKLR